MEHSKSFKTYNTSKKDPIWQKPSIQGSDKERGEKGSGRADSYIMPLSGAYENVLRLEKGMSIIIKKI